MTSLSTNVVTQLGVESYEILLRVYADLSSKISSPPSLDLIYNVFREEWIDEIHEFITVNADGFEIDISELHKTNLTLKLSEWGFPVPSQIKIHQILNALGVSYVTHREEIMNCSVVEIW